MHVRSQGKANDSNDPRLAGNNNPQQKAAAPWFNEALMLQIRQGRARDQE